MRGHVDQVCGSLVLMKAADDVLIRLFGVIGRPPRLCLTTLLQFQNGLGRSRWRDKIDSLFSSSNGRVNDLRARQRHSALFVHPVPLSVNGHVSVDDFLPPQAARL